MKLLSKYLNGLVLLELVSCADHRGFFLESYHHARYSEFGVPHLFVQDCHSHSRQGVLRGMHFQLRRPQGKLVYVVRGEIFDVALDIRAGSPTFGQWFGTRLSSKNHRQLYISPGFAHGFQVVSSAADVVYKCTDYYDPDDTSGIAWNDAIARIAWPIAHPILSERDRRHPTLQSCDSGCLPMFDVRQLTGRADT